MIDPTIYVGICVLLFLAGTFLGRFLNRCTLRLCQHFHVWPAWKHVFEVEVRKGVYPPTRWFHRLPVIGTASLIGRSPYSGRRILGREPALELFFGLLVLLTFVCTIPPSSWGGVNAATVTSQFWAGNLFGWDEVSPLFAWGRFVYFTLLIAALFVATYIDFDLWIIPDGVTFPAMIVGFVGQFLGVGFFLVPVWIQDPQFAELSRQLFPGYGDLFGIQAIPAWIFSNHHWHAIAVSTAGFVVGGGIVWAVRIIGGWVLQREAMGFGDVILMAMIGSFIGWQAVTVVFFLAPVLALVALILISLLRFLSLVKIPPELPYGPYLSLATVVVLLGWSVIWPAVERIFLLGPFLILIAGLMLFLLAFTLLLLQGLKWLMGISPWYDEELQWRSSDQILYQAGENVDPRQGNWRLKRWPGETAGRGQLNELRWRDRCR